VVGDGEESGDVGGVDEVVGVDDVEDGGVLWCCVGGGGAWPELEGSSPATRWLAGGEGRLALLEKRKRKKEMRREKKEKGKEM